MVSAYTDANTNSYQHTNAELDTDGHVDAHTYQHCNTDFDPNTDIDRIANGDTGPGDSYSNISADLDANGPCPDADVDAGSDSYLHSNA